MVGVRINDVPGKIAASKVHIYPEPHNVTAFGNRVLAGIIKIRIEIRSFWITCSYMRQESTQRHTGEQPVIREAELEVRELQTKEQEGGLSTPEARRRQGRILSQSLQIP